jgi:hypothetical protein
LEVGWNESLPKKSVDSNGAITMPVSYSLSSDRTFAGASFHCEPTNTELTTSRSLRSPVRKKCIRSRMTGPPTEIPYWLRS